MRDRGYPSGNRFFHIGLLLKTPILACLKQIIMLIYLLAPFAQIVCSGVLVKHIGYLVNLSSI